MIELDISADELVAAILSLDGQISILDSCGVGHLGSHLLIAAAGPIETLSLSGDDAEESLRRFHEKLSGGRATAVFTFSYDLGAKLQGVRRRQKEFPALDEPDIYIALYDRLIVHDYETQRTQLIGDWPEAPDFGRKRTREAADSADAPTVRSNFTRGEYIDAVGRIQELIRSGDTYQTNLTMQMTADLPPGTTSEAIFLKLRREHPAPFAAFIRRESDAVVSASPERFFRTDGRSIRTSPIKGTRARGITPADDERLRNELLTSEKDRAENTMITDLLRNDIGRVCEFGSVVVEKLCELEEHPTLFHLVSTIRGQLRAGTSSPDIIKAIFPCGSITGAPKIRTMEIIDAIETAGRGLSMGAIGYYIPESGFEGLAPGFDVSVAIRTMVVSRGRAVFNVGGGIVIDSDPAAEYDEAMLKAKALLRAIGVNEN